MRDIKEKLIKCTLFNRLDMDEAERIVKVTNYGVKQYKKGSIIAQEGDTCTALGIILDGLVEVQKVYASGKTVTLTQFKEGNIFGEAIMFSKESRYPSTIMAAADTTIMSVGRADIIKLCSTNPQILERFIGILSDRILMLNRKVRELSYETLRHKICSILVEQYGKQKSLKVRMPFSRKSMAEFLGVQRPSLSREFINMRDEGLIDFDRDTVEIKNLELLEEYLV